jgi:hypothetical protein
MALLSSRRQTVVALPEPGVPSAILKQAIQLGGGAPAQGLLRLLNQRNFRYAFWAVRSCCWASREPCDLGGGFGST